MGVAKHAAAILFRRALVAISLFASFGLAHAQTVLPQDAKPTCTVPAAEFASWFETGAVAPNGIVTPADSVAFPNVPNCSFYKWSQQMFLWLTSPVAPKFGKGNVTFNSQAFFDVTPPDPNAQNARTFVPNEPDKPKNLSVRISQHGPLDQPVVFDRTGKIFSVVRPETGPDGKALVRDKQGQAVAIEKTELGGDGKPILRDKSGNAINYQTTKNGAPRLLNKSGKPIDMRLKSVEIKGRVLFLDARGNVIDTESGQADATVLMTQDKRLVFYALQANDVFAYFLTGAKNGKITPAPTQFPTTVDELNKIKAFALANGKALPDANALAIELKSSWVEASGLDTSKYITMTATIPTFDTTDPKKWIANGSKTTLLAMIGLHVVGSAKGHPEMIWSTFEHVDNARNGAFTYKNTAGATVSVPQNAGGKWLLSSTPPAEEKKQNQQVMLTDGANIVATGSDPIGPGDTLRVDAWGTSATDPSAADKNTELVAINNSVLGQLAAGDVRKNYILVGSTWTIGGAPPNDQNQVGTSRSANATMETTQQPSNCFKCHHGTRPPQPIGMSMLGLPNGGLSHIWGKLKPLFP